MRSAKVLATFSLMMMGLSACTGMDDSRVFGELKINPRGGFATIDLVDTETKKTFSMKPGRYVLTFNQGVMWFSDPSVEVKDANGKRLGAFEIPAKAFNLEQGTFEFFTGDPKSKYSFNILGGKRRLRQDVTRYAKLDQHCTYSETYSCTQSKEECTGSGTNRVCGNVDYTTTCTREVNGHRDELWEKENYKFLYRILFDAADFYNVAEFRADGNLQSSDTMRSSDSCN